MAKQRLDVALVQRGLVATRARAQQLIAAENVRVNGEIVTKAAQKVSADTIITLTDSLKYVGRGGRKLEAALAHFGLDVRDIVALDVGASTGGFTDCLLQHGAAQVFAVDVGHGQLAESLRADSRVISLEKTDIRTLNSLPKKIDLAVIDVSFISLTHILPEIRRFLKKRNLGVIALVKPQFEAGRAQLNRRGVIKNPAARQKAVQSVVQWAKTHGWHHHGTIESPITGGDGNVEFLAYFTVDESSVPE